MSFSPNPNCPYCNGSGVVTIKSKSNVEHNGNYREIVSARTCSCIITQILQDKFTQIINIAGNFKKASDEEKQDTIDAAKDFLDKVKSARFHLWVDLKSMYLNYVMVFELLKGIFKRTDNKSKLPVFAVKPAMTVIDHWWAKGDPATEEERQELMAADILVFEFTAKADNKKEKVAFAEAVSKYISYGKRIWLLYSSSDQVFSSTAWDCPELQKILKESSFRRLGDSWS